MPDLLPTKECLNCGKSSSGLKACSRCKKAYFCNAECQKACWKVHKAECTPPPPKKQPWNMLTFEARKHLAYGWRASEFCPHLPACIVRAASVRVRHRVGNVPHPPANDEIELLGVAEPSRAAIVQAMQRYLEDSAATSCTTRVAAAPSLEPTLPAHEAQGLSAMMRELYSRGSSGMTPPNPEQVLLELVSADSLPDDAFKVCSPDALQRLLGGYEWAWLEIVSYDELWVPCHKEAQNCRYAGIQVLGRLPLASRNRLERLLMSFAAPLDEQTGLEVPIAVDVEFWHDPLETDKTSGPVPAPVPSAHILAAYSATSCVQCGSAFSPQDARRVDLQGPCAASPMCDTCAISHDLSTRHVSLRVPGTANPHAPQTARDLAKTLTWTEQNVQPPLDVGLARGSHHPEATCDGCGTRGFTGPLWKCASAVDGVLCDGCFGSRILDEGEKADTEAWCCLPSYGNGYEAVFKRKVQPFYFATRGVKDKLVMTTRVYERLWSQGQTFDPSWRANGLVEMFPLPPKFQPKIRPMQERWEGAMRSFFASHAAAVAKASDEKDYDDNYKQSTGAPTPPRSPPPPPTTTLTELRESKPKTNTPLIYEVPNFLSESECDHFMRLGAHRCAPAAGGLCFALGQAEWPACDAVDKIAADVEQRVGMLVGCPPHEDDGGVKVQYSRHDAEPTPMTEAYAARRKEIVEAACEPGMPVRAPEGMHLDTNKKPYRFVTVLVYLNDVPHSAGGQTTFPLASEAGEDIYPALLEDAEFCTKSNAHHTHDHTEHEGLNAALKRLNKAAERSANGKGGVRLRPTRGTAVVFYSRGTDGEVDPRALHFSASLLAPGPGKWTLQFFKEVPKAARVSVEALNGYVKTVHPLLPPPLPPPPKEKPEVIARRAAIAKAKEVKREKQTEKQVYGKMFATPGKISPDTNEEPDIWVDVD